MINHSLMYNTLFKDRLQMDSISIILRSFPDSTYIAFNNFISFKWLNNKSFHKALWLI